MLIGDAPALPRAALLGQADERPELLKLPQALASTHRWAQAVKSACLCQRLCRITCQAKWAEALTDIGKRGETPFYRALIFSAWTFPAEVSSHPSLPEDRVRKLLTFLQHLREPNTDRPPLIGRTTNLLDSETVLAAIYVDTQHGNFEVFGLLKNDVRREESCGLR
jgi:hypothetical protein